MLRSASTYIGVAIVVCLGLTGCTALDYTGDDLNLSQMQSLRHDPDYQRPGSLGSNERGTDFFGVSNEARQIERNCGAK
jgi:hypothetical protein